MNIRQLAQQNIKGNWRNYKVFFLSSCFAIFASFAYMSVIVHPYMQETMWYQNVRWGLIICNVIIISFFVIFILYSTSIFIEARKKELGLYMLMGATKSNVIGVIMTEQMLIGIFANIFGIGLGMIFLKLFFMVFSMLLQLPKELPVIFDVRAIGLTLVTYMVVFVVLSFISALRIWNIKIIRLLKEFRTDKKEKKTSMWLCIFGFICLGVGYTLALQAAMPTTIALYFFPVSILVFFGTYFSFTHGVAQVLEMIKRNKKIMYTYPYLFIVNQLSHRMKENGRFFFLMSMATTFVVTATGTVFLYFSGMQDMWRGEGVHSLSYIEKGTSSHKVFAEGTVEQLLHQYGYDDFQYMSFVGVYASFQSNKGETEVTPLIKESEYNQEARKQKQKTYHPKKGTVTLVYYNKYNHPNIYDQKEIQFQVMNRTYSFVFNGQKEGIQFNYHPSHINGLFFVMNDEDFDSIANQIPDSEKMIYRGYTLLNIENTKELNEDLRKHMKQDNNAFRSNMELYVNMKAFGDITRFIGSFISILFFLTSCSIVYFKWFHNISTDRKQYGALSKLGMTKEEVWKISRWQLCMLFFAPIIVGSMHSAVALYTFHNTIFMDGSLRKVGLFILFYIAACIIYFFFAQREYRKHLD